MKQLRGDDHSWVPAMIVTSYFYIYGLGRLVTIGHRTGGGGGGGSEGSGGSGGTAGCNQYYLQWMFWPVVTTHCESRSSIFCEPTVVFAISQLTDNHS